MEAQPSLGEPTGSGGLREPLLRDAEPSSSASKFEIAQELSRSFSGKGGRSMRSAPRHSQQPIQPLRAKSVERSKIRPAPLAVRHLGAMGARLRARMLMRAHGHHHHASPWVAECKSPPLCHAQAQKHASVLHSHTRFFCAYMFRC